MGDQTAKSFADDSTLPPNGMGTPFLWWSYHMFTLGPCFGSHHDKKGRPSVGQQPPEEKGFVPNSHDAVPAKRVLVQGLIDD